MNPAVLRTHCPHDLRLVLDLDGDERNGHEHNHGSLVVSLWGYPCEVPPHDTVHATNPHHYVFTEPFIHLKYRPLSAGIAPSHCLLLLPPHARTSWRRVSISRGSVSGRRTSLFCGASTWDGGTQYGEGAPLVVPLECLILGVLPVSVLPIVVTPLGAVACSTFWGACLGRSWRGLGGARVDSTRS
jgi:hypothetical protein